MKSRPSSVDSTMAGGFFLFPAETASCLFAAHRNAERFRRNLREHRGAGEPLCARCQSESGSVRKFVDARHSDPFESFAGKRPPQRNANSPSPQSRASGRCSSGIPRRRAARSAVHFSGLDASDQGTRMIGQSQAASRPAFRRSRGHGRFRPSPWTRGPGA